MLHSWVKRFTSLGGLLSYLSHTFMEQLYQNCYWWPLRAHGWEQSTAWGMIWEKLTGGVKLLPLQWQHKQFRQEVLLHHRNRNFQEHSSVIHLIHPYLLSLRSPWEVLSGSYDNLDCFSINQRHNLASNQIIHVKGKTGNTNQRSVWYISRTCLIINLSSI